MSFITRHAPAISWELFSKLHVIQSHKLFFKGRRCMVPMLVPFDFAYVLAADTTVAAGMEGDVFRLQGSFFAASRNGTRLRLRINWRIL